MTNRAVFISLLMTCMLFAVALAQAASITTGQTVDIDGSVRLLNTGNSLCFPDGSCQTSAIITDSSTVNAAIAALVSTDTTQNENILLRQLLSEKNQPNGYVGLNSSGFVPENKIPFLRMSSYPLVSVPVMGSTPLFQSQGAIWQALPEFDLSFDVYDPNLHIELSLDDNVGVYGASFCNLGIFVDSAANPVCYGLWSGVPSVYSFSQHNISCYIGSLTSGTHHVSVKHRSQGCIYGNYWQDEYSAMRKLTVKVVH